MAKPKNSEMSRSEFTIRQFDDHEIRQRNSDGYFDATELCRVGGKSFADWNRLKSAQEYLTTLSGAMGIPITELVVVQRDNFTGESPGTWIHPRAAMRLAQWVSPKFAILVDGWVMDLVEGRSNSFGEPPADPAFIDQVSVDAVFWISRLDDATVDHMASIVRQYRRAQKAAKKAQSERNHLKALLRNPHVGLSVDYEPEIEV